MEGGGGSVAGGRRARVAVASGGVLPATRATSGFQALARLETYEQARKVLNKARETLPTEPAIWITAAKLEEANGNGAMVGKIVERAVKSLGNHGVSVDREYWLKEAEAAEKNDPPALAVCREIVRVTVGAGVEEDMKRTWKADAAECEKRGSTHTARAILTPCAERFPQERFVGAVTKLEKSVGDSAAMDALLKRAVVHCPRAEILWLMAAKERWLCGDVRGLPSSWRNFKCVNLVRGTSGSPRSSSSLRTGSRSARARYWRRSARGEARASGCG